MSKTLIVIPDAGPLITLAKAGALELLLAFDVNAEIVLTDTVEFEATRMRTEHADAQKICDFINGNPQRISIRSTTYGAVSIAASKARQRYEESPEVRAFFEANNLPPPPKTTIDAGEMSILSFISGLIGEPPGPPCLIIAEDDFFLRANSGALPGNASIVSTMAFLVALQKINPKIKASAVMDDAQTLSRPPNMTSIDKPAEKLKNSAPWQDSIDEANLKTAIEKRLMNKKKSPSSPGSKF